MCTIYVYFKSPKKCKELEDVVSELKECVSTSEFPASGGLTCLWHSFYCIQGMYSGEDSRQIWGLLKSLALIEDPKT